MQVRDHVRNISWALYRALCIHIFHPYGHNVIIFNLFLLLIAVYINLVDLND